MTLREAISIVKKEGNYIPKYAFESGKYFIFNLADNTGNLIANNSAFVVDKENRKGTWMPSSAFPLDDNSDIFKEYDEERIRSSI